MKEPQRMFWFVWNEHRSLPKHKHFTLQEAKAEAHRLAMQCPGEEFHVLALLTSCAHKSVVWREPQYHPDDMENEVPF